MLFLDVQYYQDSFWHRKQSSVSSIFCVASFFVTKLHITVMKRSVFQHERKLFVAEFSRKKQFSGVGPNVQNYVAAFLFHNFVDTS
jgi:hypothetical protein